MHDDTIERFTAAIDWLKKNRIILSQVEFAERAHFNPSQISEMLNGKRKISERTIHKISAAFPEISNAWLLTGEGEMLKHESPTELKSNTSIPFYDIDVTASIAEAFHDTPEIPQYYIAGRQSDFLCHRDERSAPVLFSAAFVHDNQYCACSENPGEPRAKKAVADCGNCI